MVRGWRWASPWALLDQAQVSQWGIGLAEEQEGVSLLVGKGLRLQRQMSACSGLRSAPQRLCWKT